MIKLFVLSVQTLMSCLSCDSQLPPVAKATNIDFTIIHGRTSYSSLKKLRRSRLNDHFFLPKNQDAEIDTFRCSALINHVEEPRGCYHKSEQNSHNEWRKKDGEYVIFTSSEIRFLWPSNCLIRIKYYRRFQVNSRLLQVWTDFCKMWLRRKRTINKVVIM